MEKNPLPQKSNSFSSSSASRDEKLRGSDRQLSLGHIRFEERQDKQKDDDGREPTIEEGAEEKEINEEEEEGKGNEEGEGTQEPEEAPEPDFLTISEDIDQFLAVLRSLRDAPDQETPEPPEIPEATIDKFVSAMEEHINMYESGEDKWTAEHDELSLLDAVDRVSRLASALTPFATEPSYMNAMNRAGGVLHHAMTFLEDEFHAILDESRARQEAAIAGSSKTKRPPSFSRQQQLLQQQQQQAESDRCFLSPHASGPAAEGGDSGDAAASAAAPAPPYPPEAVERLRGIAGTMMSAGYETECCQVFSVARRNAFDAALSALGWERISIDDVQRMAWETLESEIGTWTKALRSAVTAALPQERDLLESVFAGRDATARELFQVLAGGAILQLLNFAEAIALTKRSTERLFKVLDMYEALRDALPDVDAFFAADGGGDPGIAGDEWSSSLGAEVMSEINAVRSRLGEAAVSIFCELESAIRSDTGKTPVPGGAVHPLTRYVMNYVKYAGEYKSTLEQVFRERQKFTKHSSSHYDDMDDDSRADGDGDGHSINSTSSDRSNNDPNPFAEQLMGVMELLHANLEGKSKLYRDLALCNIFLMNNGRYVMKKIRGAAELNELLGDAWCRRRSSDLRQYHQNYKRETWSKVLACFKDDGLTVKGSVSKPVLKERFKSFNQLFDEIHRTQSAWVVSDEQLQSELRVSVQAVVVPAYRSFLGRFSQYLDPGRQTEKYIKFGPEELESYVDELFDGNPASVARRRT